jgi:hypothetical protein
MANQDMQAKRTESKEEQAEKLRRVLSVKDPAQAHGQSKPSEAQPKHPVR